jgi:hypothetical protein
MSAEQGQVNVLNYRRARPPFWRNRPASFWVAISLVLCAVGFVTMFTIHILLAVLNEI